MAIIIYGLKQAPIDIAEVVMSCPSCESDSFAEIMVYSNYYHIFFIPIYPVSKEVNIICQKCGLKSYHVPFPPKSLKDYDQLKSRFKHPWYTYSFTGFVAAIILIVIIFHK